jgi:hypothetical protein
MDLFVKIVSINKSMVNVLYMLVTSSIKYTSSS